MSDAVSAALPPTGGDDPASDNGGPAGEPPRLLRDGRIQSLLGFRSRTQGVDAFEAASRKTVHTCADGARLEVVVTPGRSGRTVAVVHGWEGSARSRRLTGLAASLWREGHTIVRPNLRDHGGTHALNTGIFHFGRRAEVIEAVLASSAGTRLLAVVGFSLGGNVVLGEAGRLVGHHPDVRLFAVSPIVNPAGTLDALERHGRTFGAFFEWRWRRSLAIKAAHFPEHVDIEAIRGRRGLRALSDHLSTTHAGAASLAEHHARHAVLAPHLEGVASRVTIVTAVDDPLIPVADFAAFERLRELDLRRSEWGGHCGFAHDLRGRSWVDRLIHATISRTAARGAG